MKNKREVATPHSCSQPPRGQPPYRAEMAVNKDFLILFLILITSNLWLLYSSPSDMYLPQDFNQLACLCFLITDTLPPNLDLLFYRYCLEKGRYNQTMCTCELNSPILGTCLVMCSKWFRSGHLRDRWVCQPPKAVLIWNNVGRAGVAVGVGEAVGLKQPPGVAWPQDVRAGEEHTCQLLSLSPSFLFQSCTRLSGHRTNLLVTLTGQLGRTSIKVSSGPFCFLLRTDIIISCMCNI